MIPELFVTESHYLNSNDSFFPRIPPPPARHQLSISDHTGTIIYSKGCRYRMIPELFVTEFD